MNRYEILLDLDTSTLDYDREAVAMLLWAKDGSGLFVLYASGCVCCSTMMNDITAENAVAVTDLLATAKDLYTLTTDSDTPDVPALRAALVRAIELTGYTAPMPSLEG